MNFYFYPPRKKNNQTLNPYCDDFKDTISQYGSVVNKDEYSYPLFLNILKHLFDADVYIFNWIESLPFHKCGFIQSIIFMSAFCILKIRKAKIVWVFHNFKSHFKPLGKENLISKIIKQIMLKFSNIIITHSREALEYLDKITSIPCKFYHHPIPISFNNVENLTYTDHKNFDVLIWGNILKYKGVKEFLQYLKDTNSLDKFRILIVGSCSDKKYDAELRAFSNKKLRYENRMVLFNELPSLINSSRYVLFPYLKESVSSSGALIDTIALGGTPIGPNRGAFKDMEMEKTCLVYDSYSDLIIKLEKDHKIDMFTIKRFIASNSWDSFGEKFIEALQTI
jgi:glycosyltransferase involved in cell wall biosynthesis